MKTFSIESIYNWYRDLIRNSKYRWLVIFGSLLYLVSPVDLVPDIFPVVGWIDDGIIATLLISELSQVLLNRLKAKGKQTAAIELDPDTDTSVDVDAVPLK